jgi:Uma2 family endonuclease
MLFFCIRQFLMASGVGGEVLVETGIQFDSNTLARPDVCYWDAQHLAAIGRNRSPVEVVPQLLAEVVSPSNSLRTLFRNAEYYLRADVQIVWLLNRDPYEIHLFEKGGLGGPVHVGEMLDGESVLPGFSESASRFVPIRRLRADRLSRRCFPKAGAAQTRKPAASGARPSSQ